MKVHNGKHPVSPKMKLAGQSAPTHPPEQKPAQDPVL